MYIHEAKKIKRTETHAGSRMQFVIRFLPPLSFYSIGHNHVKAMLFLISAMARAGFRPLGHVREQLRIVWQRYKLMLLLSASWRSAFFSSRESAIQR